MLPACPSGRPLHAAEGSATLVYQRPRRLMLPPTLLLRPPLRCSCCWLLFAPAQLLSNHRGGANGCPGASGNETLRVALCTLRALLKTALKGAKLGWRGWCCLEPPARGCAALPRQPGAMGSARHTKHTSKTAPRTARSGLIIPSAGVTGAAAAVACPARASMRRRLGRGRTQR